MMRTLVLGGVALVLAVSASAVPSPDRNARSLYVGSWQVTFENGVIETCAIGPDGAAMEKEPNRSAKGKAERQGNAVVIRFDDDRVERWTRLNGRVEVEHWYPAAQFPNGPRVLGIADQIR